MPDPRISALEDMTEDPSQALGFDEIGYWSEIKLEIVKRYAKEYTTILSNQRNLSCCYIDGFAGSGVNLTRHTRNLVPGSPLNALRIDPAFDEYFLVDLDGDKIEQLRRLPEVCDRENVKIFHGDCNSVLLEDVFPNVRYEDYKRGLCLLDPYGLHLDWQVMDMAGELGTLDIFLNFPIMDMNRNALWRCTEKVSEKGIARMNDFWGDESWREVAYEKHPTLWNEDVDVKRGNPDVVKAFRARLQNVAGFKHVSEPIPMRNSTNAEIYYLFFASQRPVAIKIVNHIFDLYRERRT